MTPPDAVTVTVAWIGGGELETDPPPPPQALTKHKPIDTTMNITSWLKRLRFLQKKRQRATEGSMPPNPLRPRKEAELDVWMVRVAEAGVPAKVTDDGAKLHDAPRGNPEQPN